MIILKVKRKKNYSCGSRTTEVKWVVDVLRVYGGVKYRFPNGFMFTVSTVIQTLTSSYVLFYIVYFNLLFKLSKVKGNFWSDAVYFSKCCTI